MPAPGDCRRTRAFRALDGAASTPMHPRNRFKGGDELARLIQTAPSLRAFAVPDSRGKATIDLAQPAAVAALNGALLHDAYGLHWSIPAGAWCPPVPEACDYLHHLADLLSGGAETAIPRGPAVAILDIGSGPGCLHPMLGASDYGWRFVATNWDQGAHRWARQIVRVNRSIAPLIEGRLQADPQACFAGVTRPGEVFAASMCHPPRHASAEEARRGRAGEGWCEGGEAGFIERMIAESARRPRLCFWFTTRVATSAHLPRLRRALARVEAAEVRTIATASGRTRGRILAWTYMRA